jgi:hypothetical protein
MGYTIERGGDQLIMGKQRTTIKIYQKKEQQ